MFYFASTPRARKVNLPGKQTRESADDLWAGLVRRLFPWRVPDRAPGSRPRVAPLELGNAPTTGNSIVRAQSFDGVARFSGRTIDKLLLSATVRSNRLPTKDQFRRVVDEIHAAHALYRANRLVFPDTFHSSPPPLERPSIHSAWHPSLRFEWVSFESGYDPHTDDLARSRWFGYERNHTAHAWVVRHRDPNRPWLVCLHGLGTGGPYTDFSAFRARVLHHEYGLNLLLPVLPLHGPRKDPEMPIGSLLSYELLDAFHGVSQALWDTRRLIQWARSQGAQKIGLYGISMGAYVSALLAGLEDFDAVIAGIPLCDIPDLFLHHAPKDQRRNVSEHETLVRTLKELFELVSPLEVEPIVPRDERFIFAASDDQISTSWQAERLWKHWDEPGIHWFPGGHVSFFFSKDVRAAIDSRLHSAGFGVLDR